MLTLSNVVAAYGPSEVLHDVNITVGEGEIVALLGANAAGKTTTMKTIFGLVRAKKGEITFSGQRIERAPTSQIVRSGLALVPEARRIFSRMTVYENLQMGAFTRARGANTGAELDRVYTLFPRLKERAGQLGGTLSGGEQQMLAMGRAMMAHPRLICMDEPSMGLSPLLVQTVFDTIEEIRRSGVTVFLVEQNAFMALNVADRGYVLQQGKVVLADNAKNLLTNDLVRKAYLGG
ncbi:MAG TPA: ABC transporter ATP-binding protein [Ktedonobacterales bacterium]